jgi:phosphonate transport system substrate-binding protein
MLLHNVRGLLLLVLLATTAVVAGCGGDGGSASAEPQRVLRIGTIPDQDPQELQRLYGVVADTLGKELGVRVEYRPVTDYAAAVTAFRVGDLDLVWFGGLTGVQARGQVDGAQPLAQRDIDRSFHSVFIASAKSGIESFEDLSGLRAVAGKRLTFGSQTSTSGRLMPQSFLAQAGVGLDDLRGEPGFSGAHDRTIELVEAGAYEVGALNEQVWKDRLKDGDVDRKRMRQIWRSPAYNDYQRVARPDLDERLGTGFSDRTKQALFAIDGSTPQEQQILELFGAGAFVPVGLDDHAEIVQAAETAGLLGQ